MTMAAPSRRAFALLLIALVCSGHVTAFHTAPIAPLRSAKSASPSLRGSTATRAGLPLYMSSKNNEVRRNLAHASIRARHLIGVGCAISRRGAACRRRLRGALASASMVWSWSFRGWILDVERGNFPDHVSTRRHRSRSLLPLSLPSWELAPPLRPMPLPLPLPPRLPLRPWLPRRRSSPLPLAASRTGAIPSSSTPSTRTRLRR